MATLKSLGYGFMNQRLGPHRLCGSCPSTEPGAAIQSRTWATGHFGFLFSFPVFESPFFQCSWLISPLDDLPAPCAWWNLGSCTCRARAYLSEYLDTELVVQGPMQPLAGTWCHGCSFLSLDYPVGFLDQKFKCELWNHSVAATPSWNSPTSAGMWDVVLPGTT